MDEFHTASKHIMLLKNLFLDQSGKAYLQTAMSHQPIYIHNVESQRSDKSN